ncbi:MAG TPA: hypothetical protein VMB03_05645 [Bryobacteraceae bacterium]|nr:hypothetical protein [Bryobacteraceae bacterium]
MRRALAWLLLAEFSFPLIAPALFADAESNLPECCRRGGKHHCAMMMDDAPVTGVSFRSAHARCPLYPGISATPAGDYVAVLNSSVLLFGALVSHPAIFVQTEAVYRISFSRERQKRGPPVTLS